MYYLRILFLQDFTPEILTSRSRAESFALARREVMEKEIEVHERERIQTARKGTDTEDSVVANGVLNLSCLTVSIIIISFNNSNFFSCIRTQVVSILCLCLCLV